MGANRADRAGELAERAREYGRLAIDTEFVSERRYQALLCLVQVAVPDPSAPDGVRTEVLDPLADQPPDPAPLADALADPAIEVLMHAGRHDVGLLRRSWGTDVSNVFDKLGVWTRAQAIVFARDRQFTYASRPST